MVARTIENASLAGLSPHQRAERNRLLENQLLELQRRRVKIQTERDDEVRRKLKIEIEEERAKANERAAEMRRALRIEIEE